MFANRCSELTGDRGRVFNERDNENATKNYPGDLHLVQTKNNISVSISSIVFACEFARIPPRKDWLYRMDAVVHPIEPSISVPQIDQRCKIGISIERGFSLAMCKQRDTHAAKTYTYLSIVRENSALRRNLRGESPDNVENEVSLLA